MITPATILPVSFLPFVNGLKFKAHQRWPGALTDVGFSDSDESEPKSPSSMSSQDSLSAPQRGSLRKAGGGTPRSGLARPYPQWHRSPGSDALVRDRQASTIEPDDSDILDCNKNRMEELRDANMLIYRAYNDLEKLATDLTNIIGVNRSTEYDLVSCSVGTADGFVTQTGEENADGKYAGCCGIVLDYKKVNEIDFGCQGDGKVLNMWNPKDLCAGSSESGKGRAEWDVSPGDWNEFAKIKHVLQRRLDTIACNNDGMLKRLDSERGNPKELWEQELGVGEDWENKNCLGKGPRVMFGNSDKVRKLLEGQTVDQKAEGANAALPKVTGGLDREIVGKNNYFGKDAKGFSKEKIVEYLGAKWGVETGTNKPRSKNEVLTTFNKNAIIGIWVNDKCLKAFEDNKEDARKVKEICKTMLNRPNLPIFELKEVEGQVTKTIKKTKLETTKHSTCTSGTDRFSPREMTRLPA